MCDLCSKSMSSCPLVRLLPASYYFVHIWVMHSHFFGFLRSLVNTQSIGFSLLFSFAVVAVPVVTAVGLMPFLNVFHFLIFVLWSQSWSHCVGSSMASWWCHSDFFQKASVGKAHLFWEALCMLGHGVHTQSLFSTLPWPSVLSQGGVLSEPGWGLWAFFILPQDVHSLCILSAINFPTSFIPIPQLLFWVFSQHAIYPCHCRHV